MCGAEMREHKAVKVEAFNEKDPATTCKVVTVMTPKPGPNEVLVKMLCRPINPSDVIAIQGNYEYGGNGSIPLPFTPGFEGMGKIYELGENVNGLVVGQRVYILSIGTWQEYLVTSADFVFPLPDSVSDEVAAQLFVNPGSACGLLDELEVPKGEYVLQTAAASVLGRMFIQLARHQGIKTINIVRRNELKDELKDIGADEVINSKEENVIERVKEITGGKMAYGAVDCVGGKLTKDVCSSVRNSGTVLVYGMLDGFNLEANTGDLVFRNVKLHGFHLTNWMTKPSDPKDIKEVAANVLQLIAKKVIVPLAGEKFTLDNISDAIRKSQAAGRGGKVLVVSE